MLNLLFTLLACFGEYSPSVSKGLISDGNIEESDSLVLDRDNDNDGFSPSEGDCDDENPLSFPEAEERCDEIDNNCNGLIDEGHNKWWYLDFDADGFGDINETHFGCVPVAGYVENPIDCNDADFFIHPDAQEACNNIDDNCDGKIDEELNFVQYFDADGDGFGDPLNVTEDCSPISGYVGIAGDCNDGDIRVNPARPERCNNIDDNCDTLIDNDALDALPWYEDTDNDTFGNPLLVQKSCTQPEGYSSNLDDCDDSNSSINPNAAEVCNNIDDNCNTQIDENPSDGTLYFRDADIDGFGDPNAFTNRCSLPSGYRENSDDCDDTNSAVNPNATEVCNTIDDNCNTQIDDDDPSLDLTTRSLYFRDADSDLFGTPNQTLAACAQPNGYVADNTDCNDLNPAQNPSEIERCNNIDDDCDTLVDVGATDAVFWYADTDRDAFGDANNRQKSCSAPAGFLADASDCDDTNSAVNPNATEVCNNIDDNCDSLVDVGAVDSLLWYLDSDSDGYGDPDNLERSCTPISGYRNNNDDCNDLNSSVNPAKTEICNNIDDNCDSLVDNNPINGASWYRDFDRDGFGNLNRTQKACSQPSGYVTDSTDCNDADTSINPSAPEICDNADNNCNTQIDENPVDGSTFYLDADRDGFGDPTGSKQACSLPNGFSSDNTDCDDIDASVNP
ncbi:MAG: putative metal-binding motif-containing protein, partial [Myxococcota bacterium]|nr:putative metal-binding motif-containing protein [Myxococcota bacterium]